MESGTPIQPKAGWAIGLGILMMVLGMVAIAAPIFTSFAANLVLGWLFILGGIVQGIYAFQHHQRGRSLFLNVVLALIALIVGIILIANPLAGVVSLTLLVGLYFLADGIFRVFLAFQLRPQPRWGWVLINAILMIILGVLIWSQWPFNAPWLLGLLVGVGLLVNGFASLIYGITVRSMDQDY